MSLIFVGLRTSSSTAEEENGRAGVVEASEREEEVEATGRGELRRGRRSRGKLDQIDILKSLLWVLVRGLLGDNGLGEMWLGLAGEPGWAEVGPIGRSARPAR